MVNHCRVCIISPIEIVWCFFVSQAPVFDDEDLVDNPEVPQKEQPIPPTTALNYDSDHSWSEEFKEDEDTGEKESQPSISDKINSMFLFNLN